MKKVLIMVISSQYPPYDKMVSTSFETWDSISVPGVETIFYFGQPMQNNTDRQIYFDFPESYHSMSRKTVAAFKWALENKEFDCIARVNASTYVNKESLLKYIQSLPYTGVFNGLVADGVEMFMWGPFFILSKDVVKLYVENESKIDHRVMDDLGISRLLSGLGVELSRGIGCSIDRSGDNWRAICYGTESFEFSDFSEIVRAKDHWGFRCKQDGEREKDEYIMKELFKHLS